MTVRSKTWALVLLMLSLSGAVVSLSFWLSARTETLLQRTLIAYEQLALATRLEAAVVRERYQLSQGAHGTLASDQLLAQLVATVAREVAQLESPEQRGEEVELASIGALKVARDTYFMSGDDNDWRYLAQLLSAFERAESQEIQATLAILSTERDRIGRFVAVIGALPLTLAFWLLWQLFNQHKQLEREVQRRTIALEEQAAELAAIDRQRRVFFAKLSHELRTPLTVLRAEADVAASVNTAEHRRQQSVAVMQQHAQLLSRRFSDLLALARSDAGELVIAKEPTELALVVNKAIALTHAMAEKKAVPLKLQGDVIDDVEVLADGEWLLHVLMALIDNAVKASETGQTVTVVTARTDQEITLAVEDEGPGVDPVVLPQLIKPFQQSGSYASEQGSGLGLAVAHWIAEQHGGHLTLQNGRPRGFRAALALPLL